jgi:catechol 2,3-dioxygenase-like lactoylglutathione lyase family enzyme
MLGRFLEISVYTPDIQASLEFYESLGFVQASVGEAWPHPYAVVTDGRLFLGLHGAPMRSPAITFVLPELARGIDVFNRATFTDPTGMCVNVLEARTFSPPADVRPTTCGYFVEFGVPVRDTAVGRAFWESLGFVAMEEETQPFARVPLTSDRLNLGLYRTRAFREPLLAFEDPDMRERLTRLRERGFELLDEMPDSMDESTNAVLRAPEGTRLLLMQSES